MCRKCCFLPPVIKRNLHNDRTIFVLIYKQSFINIPLNKISIENMFFQNIKQLYCSKFNNFHKRKNNKKGISLLSLGNKQRTVSSWIVEWCTLAHNTAGELEPKRRYFVTPHVCILLFPKRGLLLGMLGASFYILTIKHIVPLPTFLVHICVLHILSAVFVYPWKPGNERERVGAGTGSIGSVRKWSKATDPTDMTTN